MKVLEKVGTILVSKMLLEKNTFVLERKSKNKR
jgi:hypothetical protein